MTEIDYFKDVREIIERLERQVTEARKREQRLRIALAEIAAVCTPTLDAPHIDRVAVISGLVRAALEDDDG